MISTDPRPSKNPEAFGPKLEDIAEYKELLGELERGEKPGFEPMFNAESVSEGLDQGTLVLPVSKGEQNGKYLKERHRLGFAQQRYVAGALGFNVGPTYFGDDGTVSAKVDYPDVAKLPERPILQADGSFLGKDGAPLSMLRADAIHTAHFIAGHPDKFREPGAFQKVFEKIRDSAVSGSVSINPKTFPDDPEGAQAFIRQSARLMGFEVGEFQVVDDNAELTIKGTRKGFDSNKTSFFNVTPENLVNDLDRDRLRDLTEQTGDRTPSPLFGKDVILSEHDKFQFDLIAKATRAYIERFMEEDPDWKALQSLLDTNSHKIHSIVPHEKKYTLVSSTYVDGGESAKVMEIRPPAGSEGGFRIQVPTKVLNALQWEAMARTFENFRDYSNDTIKGMPANTHLGRALRSAPSLINAIRQGRA